MKKDDFITPAAHVGFLAKRLFGREEGRIKDGAVAYLEPGGGGPTEQHTHNHDHLFIVVKGEATMKTTLSGWTEVCLTQCGMKPTKPS